MNVFHVIIVSFVMLLSAKSVYDCYMNYILCNFAYESLYSWTERGVLQRHKEPKTVFSPGFILTQNTTQAEPVTLVP